MAVRQNGRTIKDGLIFHFDTGDFYNSYKGEPTTNMNGTGVPNIYSWWSRSIQTITTLNETYHGQPIYRVSLSLDIPDQVSYANSRWGAGTGWYLGGQTYNANTPYMVSTIYRPVSHPDIQIYGHPSNISGWGLNVDSSVDYYDGWKLHRIDRNFASTASDARYFHIHAPTAVLNDVISVDITHMQIEAKNRRTYFTRGTRSNTEGLINTASNVTLDLSTVSFSSDTTSKINFDGSDDYINLSPSAIPTGNQITIEIVTSWSGGLQNNSIIAGGSGNQDLSLHLPWSDGNVYWDCGSPFNRIVKTVSSSADYLGNHHWVVSKNATTGIMRIYLDGTLWHYGGGQTSTIPSLASVSIGRYDNGSFRGYYYKGDIPVLKIYNKELTPEEVHKNYLHYKSRYGLRDVKSLTSVNSLGAAAESASPSAKLLQEHGFTSNGTYWLKPTGVSTPFLAYVEFDSNGGDPWVHVGTIDDEDAPSNNSTYHKWSNDMNATQSCPPWDNDELFGGSTPTFVSDYKNAGWTSIPFSQIMIKDSGNTQRKLLYTNEGQIKSNNSSLSSWFGSLKWGALGSDASNDAFNRNRVKAINITNFGVNDPVLQSSGKSKLLFKYGEIDGAQDGNKDRTMIAWHRHDAGDGVDGPSGLGCFTNRGGTIDFRDIVPGSVYGSGQDFPPSNIGGTYYYSIWIR
jgi:hypothetical protein